MRPTPRIVAVVAGVVALSAGGCGSSGGAARSGSVRVVAAENFWGDVARQVGGDHASVTSLVSDPNTDPHQFESDAHDAAAVADASIVIVNGAGYDDFVSKLLSSTSKRGRVVVNVEQVLHVGGNANPHLWYDVPRVSEVAAAIERALSAADPADATSFATGRAGFDASLQPVLALVRTLRAKYAGAPVAYTERVPEYLLAAAGLRVATPSGFARAIEDGNEPSAGDAQALDDLVTQHRVRALLYNAQATSPVTEHVQDLARRSGIPVVAVTETMPKSEPSYQAWQQHQLEALLRALGG